MFKRILPAVIVCISILPCQSKTLAQTKSDPKPKTETADQDIPAGHSMHGEAFNEGPRQQAYLMEGTGKIEFPVTSKNPEVRKFIEQGIGQLHGFWYFEAERSFRQAAKLDPNCAIAYWGMAMANYGNSKRAKGFIEKAVKLKDKAGKREQMYIEALDDYLNAKGKSASKAKKIINAFKEIHKEFPDDLEAHAFLGYYLYRFRGTAKLKYEDVDAELKKVLEKNPLHPVHHYIIHLWDYKKPANALKSAAMGGPSAPGIAHLWHMPGHTYSRLKRYKDAVYQQEASARVDHAYMIKNRVMPDEIHNFAHNNEWLIRNLMYTGRWQDALDLAKNMTELPRHPKYNTLTKRRSTYYGRRRLFEVLQRYELWPQTIALSKTTHLEPTDDDGEQIKRLRHLGIAFAQTGKSKEAKDIISDLNKRLEELNSNKKRDSKKKTTVLHIQQAVAAIECHLAFAAGDYDEAYARSKMSGEEAEFMNRVKFLAGEQDEAIKAMEKRKKGAQNQVLPLATLIELYWKADRKKEAKEAFDELREISDSIQFGSPVFDRLAPIAAELKLPKDWRVQHPAAKDLGPRPKLDELGPFRWHPSQASGWSLVDSSGEVHSLDQYQGKPVIVIFYLGYGCLHCAEQIHAFIPRAKDFAKEGISIIAISTDDKEGLKISEKNYKEGKITFPLVSNDKLDVFKAYKCYDDFEDITLHGTFLIDGNGFVRWQDISYEPFMDVDFLLAESKRLLGLKSTSAPQK